MNAGISINRSAAPIDPCVASGWRLHHGCVHGDGQVICPRCSLPVGVKPVQVRDGRVLAVMVNKHRAA